MEENYDKGNNLFFTSPGLSTEFSTSSTSTKHYQKMLQIILQLLPKLVFKHIKSSALNTPSNTEQTLEVRSIDFRALRVVTEQE